MIASQESIGRQKLLIFGQELRKKPINFQFSQEDFFHLNVGMAYLEHMSIV